MGKVALLNEQASKVHHWHPMAAPKLAELASPLVIERAEGVYIYDSEGKRYLDSQGGLWCVNVGHGRKEVKEAINVQLEKLPYYTTFGDTSNQPVMELAERLTRLAATEDMQRAFFGSGGSDAVETALKLSRQYWKLSGEAQRTKFISLKQGYHGVHFGGTSIGGQMHLRSMYEPVLPHCFQIDTPWLYRNPYSDDPEELGKICANLLEREIVHQGPHTVAAFIAEPVQGSGGVIVPPDNYWSLIREVCDKYGVLLIADEVVTGFGRSGSMFGSRGWGVKPDIMCLAKGINSGFVPLGATVVNERVRSAWDSDHPLAAILHGFTYSGHPLACAAANAALQIVEDEDLPGNAGKVGSYCLTKLKETVSDFDFVGDIRGKGLMMAIELVSDKTSKTPFMPGDPFLKFIQQTSREEGLFIRNLGTTLIISPPLVFTEQDVDALVDMLARTFDKAASEFAKP
ncbi:MAG: aminotransferase class III-fold pyridoxal phosphate-dependent enzyme [Gammaproteobacteria bacterium]|nr:aminotransferase class III-fold pyridoxal phosphate-dependent enzyme [Gammaproteobacteria bacterium]